MAKANRNPIHHLKNAYFPWSWNGGHEPPRNYIANDVWRGQGKRKKGTQY